MIDRGEINAEEQVSRSLLSLVGTTQEVGESYAPNPINRTLSPSCFNVLPLLTYLAPTSPSQPHSLYNTFPRSMPLARLFWTILPAS